MVYAGECPCSYGIYTEIFSDEASAILKKVYETSYKHKGIYIYYYKKNPYPSAQFSILFLIFSECVELCL